MDVFISWSGTRSQQVADALHRYLPQMINAVEPWLSSADIEAGARWSADIAGKLSKSKVGIICLTSTNLQAPWIHFEAGALAKTVDNTFVCPYLLGVKRSDVTGPLAQFQAIAADEQGTRRLVETLNRALEKPRKTEDLVEAFIMWWPKLKEALDAIAKEETTAPRRSERDMIEEILELARRQGRRVDQQATPDLFPDLATRLALEFTDADTAVGIRLQHNKVVVNLADKSGRSGVFELPRWFSVEELRDTLVGLIRDWKSQLTLDESFGAPRSHRDSTG